MALILLLAVPIIEIIVAVWVADLVGFGWMALALVGLSLLGLLLLPRVGMSSYRRVRESVARGEQPGAQIVGGLLLLLAAVLLLVPGFVTGAIGLLLLVPPVRRAAAR